MQPDLASDSPSRRTFLQAGIAALAAGSAVNAGPAADAKPEPAPAEWRNRQNGMSYRRLGRTGLMISEIVCGGDPITLENWKHLELALEMGLNYLDMAPAYNRGDTETAYGKLLAASPGRRQKVFLTTKVSGHQRLREQMYQDIFKGLPGEKQQAIQKRALELRAERGVEKPGYYFTYYPGQEKSFDATYRRIAMMPEYGERVEGHPSFRKFIVESLEGSLKRLGTDHFDTLMCPHGGAAPEELQCPEIIEVFNDLKKQGKVRFLGVSSHSDPAGVLRTATQLGHYDVVMCAYNVVNGAALDEPIRQATAKGVGVIGMKVAHAIATHHKALQPIPEWRIQMINRIIPGDMKPPMKAYLWALQNPNISAVISNLWDENYVRENLGLAGKKVKLEPG
jgi:aryl-alcohol dehydrogenase-like predicted oxidoreductase